jgi:hypothetical protein
VASRAVFRRIIVSEMYTSPRGDTKHGEPVVRAGDIASMMALLSPGQPGLSTHVEKHVGREFNDIQNASDQGVFRVFEREEGL